MKVARDKAGPEALGKGPAWPLTAEHLMLPPRDVFVNIYFKSPRMW